MFATMDEAQSRSGHRKLRIIRTVIEVLVIAVLGVAVFLVATMAVLGSVILFFALAPYASS